MATLLLVVFLVELAVHLVNTIGAASISNLVRDSDRNIRAAFHTRHRSSRLTKRDQIL